MGGQQEQHDGEANEPFLCGGKLLALIDLLPEGEVVVRATVHVRLEWDARCPVEHEVGYYEVSEVDECPAKLLGHTREGIERKFDEEDETRVH